MSTDENLEKLIVDRTKSDQVRTHLPTYDRQKLKHGIVHLSVGNFHRSHLAFYMDVLAQQHGETDWAIVGVGVRPVDKSMDVVMKKQNGLYTLVSKGTSESDIDVRIIGSIIDYLFVPEQPEQVMQVMTDPLTKIVSMTITESGYDLDLNHPDIQHDLNNAKTPKTVFGLIVHALNSRRLSKEKPFTVMSCDNVQQNGEVTKSCILKFAQALNDSELVAFIENQVTFPNAMGKSVFTSLKMIDRKSSRNQILLFLVDRITPATTDADRKYVLEHCGISDGWPVVTEPFIQWVIEDSFCNGRPKLELLSSPPYNVLLTEHVEAYECMKMRLLNASHTAMCYIGYLMGYRYIHEIMLDKSIEVYIRHLMNDEVTETLPAVPGIDLRKYKETLIERFSNPNIKDTALRVCMDGASKFPKFLVPTIVEQFKRKNSTHFCALAVASWIRYLSGEDESNQTIILQDALADELKLGDLAKKIRPKSKEILRVEQVFSKLAENETFAENVEGLVESFYKFGSKQTLRFWVDEFFTSKS